MNKLSTDLLTESNPSLVIPAVQLFLACMYSSEISVDVSPPLSSSSSSGGIDDPERLMRAMEQVRPATVYFMFMFPSVYIESELSL